MATLIGTTGADTITPSFNSTGGGLATAGADSIVGDPDFASPGNDSLDGGAGNDTLDGRGGADTLRGGTGNNALFGYDGNDLLISLGGLDSLRGEAGNDAIDLNGATDISNTLIDGGPGTDSVDLIQGTLQLGTTLPFQSIENLDSYLTLFVGTAGNDLYDFRPFNMFSPGFNLPVEIRLLSAGAGADTVYAPNTDLSILQFLVPPDQFFNKILGEAGNDLLVGGASFDWLEGGNDNDTLDGGGAADTLFGGAGADSILGGAGNDRISGDEGNDTLDGGDGADSLHGGPGLLADSLSGGDGADTLFGGNGPDTVLGGAGDDYIFSSNGTDIAVGGAGRDTLDATFFGGNYRLDMVTGLTNFAGESFTEFEAVFFGAGADTITGNAADNLLDGGLGGDSLVGAAGADTLIGGGGNDTLDGGTENDRLSGGIGLDRLIGGDGADSLDGGDDADTLEGGNGADTLLGGQGADSLLGGADGDRLEGGTEADTLDGGTEADTLIGGQGADRLIGGLGNDLLDGGTEADTLEGGDGADSLFGGGGDSLMGGDGADTINAAGGGYTAMGGDGDDYIFAVNGSDSADGGAGNDTIDTTSYNGDYRVNLLTGLTNFGGETLANFEAVFSGTGNDTLLGNAAANLMRGNAGGDSITGEAGADTLLGEAGADTLNGGSENDSLDGGDADDFLFGGAGSDILRGGDGNDYLNPGSNGANTLIGGAGNDGFDLNAITDLTGMTIDGGDGIDNIDFYEGGVQLGTTLPFVNVEMLDTYFTFFLGTAGNDSYDFTGLTFFLPGFGLPGFLILYAGDGADTVTTSGVTIGANYHLVLGETGNDVLIGAAQADYLDGGSDNDSLLGQGGDDTLVGGDGSDTLNGGAGFDQLLGGDGDDLMIATSNDTMLGGAGSDFFDLTGLADLSTVVVNGGTETDFADVATGLVQLGAALPFTSIEELETGGSTFNGTGGADLYDFRGMNTRQGGVPTGLVLQAGDGADTVYANDIAGARLGGEDGADRLVGGASADTLLGGGGADTLEGGGGHDVLDGGTGADSMAGGAGNDAYFVDDAGDAVLELAGGGLDTLYASISIILLPAEVEALVLLGGNNLAGFGNGLDNLIWGNAGNGSLRGEGGADTLVSFSGADTMNGGTGDDVYFVGAGDVVSEAGGSGADTVYSTADFTLGAGLEDLVLYGSGTLGTGNGLNNRITASPSLASTLNGANGADTLTGGAGDDSLVGGLGADSMAGGAGNDTYSVDDPGDQVIELAGGGVDEVRSSITFTLGLAVENLTLLGALAINGTGNALDNLIIGNGAANRLVGEAGADTLDGGLGADTMEGGAGDDVYVVRDATDVVVELPGGGVDLVQSFVNYTLGAQQEHLTLLGSVATAGTGNGLANIIIGNNLANTLAGAAGDDSLVGLNGNDTLNGGAGADTMRGGLGADRYTVDSPLDVIIEFAGEGNDTVVSSISYTLGDHLEGLAFNGSANLVGIGNALLNRMTGNAGDNLLRGLDGNDVLIGQDGADTLVGGNGADQLTGGTGADWFLFENAAQGQDRITDFAVGVDEIVVLQAGFGGLAPGNLAAANFVAHASNATTAPAGTPQFIYNTTTGVLRFDADGLGGAASTPLVVLTGAPAITANDILVIA